MGPKPGAGLDLRRARRLLGEAQGLPSVGARVDVLSRLLLGSPYEAGGLVGSAETPEVFTASLARFDCVTYVETVVALARAATADAFLDELRLLRYEGGRVGWALRNHYMTSWIRRNAARPGVLRALRGGALAVAKERRLDAVPGLPPKRARFTCVPKARLKRLAPHLETGDLVFFASVRKDLDVFHCGLLVRDGLLLKMRHASRSRGCVVEEELAGFLRKNRMSGVIVARPLGAAAEGRSG